MSEPVYDEDIVNLGFLKKLILETESDINNEYKNVSRHYSTRPKPPYYKGDTWIDGSIVYTCINSREIGLYNDNDWVSESGAKEEAGRKNKIYLTQPSNYNPGDMWILQSDNDHKSGKKGEILITTAGRRDYSEDDWVNMLGYGTIKSINEVANSLNNAINRIGNVEEAIEDGIIVTFYQETVPQGIHIGDLWYVTEEVGEYLKGKIYRYDGTDWVVLNDPTIQMAFDEANEARIVADGKIQSFYSDEAPKESVGVGDLWIDLGNNNQLYRYNGTNWVAVYDTRMGEVIQNLETVTERTVSIETDLGYITQRVSETEKRIDEDIEVSMTEVKQTVDEINQKVKGFKDFTKEKTYITETHLTDTVSGEGYILDLQIRGDLPFLAPSDDLVPSDTLVPFGEHFTLVLDKQNKEEMSNEAQKINITLLDPLRRITDIYDELSIKDGEIYVIRRIGTNNDSSLYLLGEPTVEYLGNVNLKTFKNDTYIYIKECVGTEIYCKYIVKNDYSDVFATKTEMNSSISQTAEEINLEVSKKVGENEIISKINQTAEDITIDASRININGTVSANGNFKIDKEGNIKATGGEIGGFKLGTSEFEANAIFSQTYTAEDGERIRDILMGTIKPTNQDYEKYDLTQDKKIDILDYFWVGRLAAGTNTVNGKFVLNTSDSRKFLQLIDSNGDVRGSIGTFGSFFHTLSCSNFNCNGFIHADGIGLLNDKILIGETNADGVDTPSILLFDKEGNQKISLLGQNGKISCVSLIQTSLEENKKNFEKLENGLDIIKSTDIYKYNLKSENNTDKKHIGFVIGDRYKYAHEITSEDGGQEVGVDTYSMISVAYKAIQEQQEQIEALQKQVNELKEALNEKN